jgi:hypothetical protein
MPAKLEPDSPQPNTSAYQVEELSLEEAFILLGVQICRLNSRGLVPEVPINFGGTCSD